MKTNSNRFDKTASVNPTRSVFDLSHSRILDADMGILYPVLCESMIPNDKFSITHEMIVRMMPLVSPVLHEINVYLHTFFVPYRILWDGWEDFISGGKNGDDASVLPTWTPTNPGTYGELWDHLGFPVIAGNAQPAGAMPMDFPRRAYARIWNEYYRDQTIQNEVVEGTGSAVPGPIGNEILLKRSWEKDYFTSAQPSQQRGVAPALPISGLTSAVFDSSIFVTQPAAATALLVSGNPATPEIGAGTGSSDGTTNLEAALNTNSVDLSSATTFDVADLRLAFQMQKFMERNQRCGVRYTEFLNAHFGVSPRDDRLQRPEFIGAIKAPITISEVLQTSETDGSPQGNMAGHGLTVNINKIGTYHAKEFGLVMTLMSIMPRPMYTQGINKQWLYSDRYEFPFPEFANLSEQPIIRAELYATGVSGENTTIFGYQGRYDELRYKPSLATGLMRKSYLSGGLNHWHLGRVFGSAPELNTTFLECVPDKRIFAVPSESGFVVNIGNIIKAVRPIPIASNPGLIDHV